VLHSYGIAKVTADRYAAQWPVAAFGRHGIKLVHSDRDRSQIYLNTLPLFTTGRVRLLDNDRLIAQFAGLVRTTLPGGRDKIDHGKTGADDLCNSAAGALLLATRDDGRPKIMAIGVDVARPTIYSDWDYYAKRIVRNGNDFWKPVQSEAD
jgi:hypothetical protein